MLITRHLTYKMPGMCQTGMFQCRSCAGGAKKLRPAMTRTSRSDQRRTGRTKGAATESTEGDYELRIMSTLPSPFGTMLRITQGSPGEERGD
jgi:hypothetical protein